MTSSRIPQATSTSTSTSVTTTTSVTTLTTKTTTTTVTTVTTTIEGHDFHTVHKEIAALRKDLTDAQATIAAQQEGVQKDIVGLRKDLTDAQQLIAAQQDLLAALLKPVAVSTAANGKGAGVKCDAVGMPSCNPSVAVVEGGGGGGVEASASQVLAIKALGGGVTFETEHCDATDLCEMARKVDALLKKFAGN